MTGKVRLQGMRPVFWLWAAVILSVFGVVYWRIAEGKLESQKTGVAAKQRAVRLSLGPRLSPFVERVEHWAVDLANGPIDEAIATDVVWDSIARKPGVYLRLLMSKTADVGALRRAAAISLNDGFTSCFFIREGAPDPTVGPKCLTSVTCPSGLLCNEWDVCSAIPRPYNMRLAYRAWRILSDDFTRSLQDATDDLQVRALDRELDQITKVDVPVAIEVLQRAKTVTIVLDEVPAELSKPQQTHPGEPVLTDEQRVQGARHDARVGIWDAVTGQQLVRWRGRAQSRLVSVGRKVQLDPEIAAAQTRQANSCFLATSLKTRLMGLADIRSADAASTAANASDAMAPNAVRR
ncbi:MAG TPA: hypothetical protein VIV60_09310 [Polyangiaceae bacterium]